MYSRLSAFLDKYDVLYSNQFGFRRGRSTDDAVLQFTDEVYNAFNNNKYLVAVMLDLSKTFDAVQSDILLGKLERIGVRGVPLEWFRSYLTGRKLFVSVNNEDSSVRTIEFGLLLGSALESLLFRSTSMICMFVLICLALFILLMIPQCTLPEIILMPYITMLNLELEKKCSMVAM